jgi:hypothetical protein
MSVDYFVAVSLLSQKALAILSKVLFDSVSGNQGVEGSGATIRLWP